MDSFNTETHKLILTEDHTIRYSEELYKIAQESADTYENIIYDKHGNERRVKLLENDRRIIKPAANARVGDYKNIINKKLVKIKMELNNPAITLNALKESGRREMVDYLVKGGMTVDGALLDEVVIETYGYTQARKRWISKYYVELSKYFAE